MRELRSQFVIWDQIGGGNYIMIAHGDGVYEKKDGFRTRREAEEWDRASHAEEPLAVARRCGVLGTLAARRPASQRSLNQTG